MKPSRGRGRAFSSSSSLYRLMKRRKEGVRSLRRVVVEVNWVERELSRSAVWVSRVAAVGWAVREEGVIRGCLDVERFWGGF